MSESAPGGEAGSSTDATDKDSSVRCPTCERDDFKNEHGMRIHHSQSHDESIAWSEVECGVCGDTVEIERYKLERQDGVYCSTECQHNGYSKDKIAVECEYCGNTEKVKESRKERFRFCSKECKARYESENWKGEDGPNWSGRVEKTCLECEESFRVCPSREHRKFCNKECLYEWMSQNVRGENHPNWKGGWSEYYGANWLTQRRKARIRDQSRCQLCGDTPLDTGEELTVHHIEKIRVYQNKYDAPKWWKLGNRLSNLMCVCRDCHHIAEQMSPLRPY